MTDKFDEWYLINFSPKAFNSICQWKKYTQKVTILFVMTVNKRQVQQINGASLSAIPQSTLQQTLIQNPGKKKEFTCISIFTPSSLPM